ncbi:MAG: hypothetical protein ACRCVS_03585, partial [Fusobacteriaceae bacterium]
MMKKTIFILTLIFFVGCSSIIGKNKLSKGVESYNMYGPSENSVLNLGQGLDYFQDSPLGIETFKTQHAQLAILKENILAKTTYSYKDLDDLRLYLLSSNFATHLASKVPTLNINTGTLVSDRHLITKIFEESILKEKTNNLLRAQKISRINYYKKILNVVKSSAISNKIRVLEQEVTVNIYIRTTSRSFYNYRNYRNSFNFEDYIYRATERRIDSSLGDYVFLRGYVIGSLPNTNNAYLIDLRVNSIDVKKISSREDNFSSDENKTVLIQNKSLFIEGGYNFYSLKGDKKGFYKSFSYDKKYEIKTYINNRP